MSEILNWQVGHSQSLRTEPEKWVKAIVPGAANLDWIRENNLPDWKADTNFEQFAWMEDCYWVYKTSIPKIEKDGYNLLLNGKGIDYDYKIYFNNELIYAYEGMYKAFSLDFTGKSGDLEILIEPVPKNPLGKANDRQEASQVCKPPCSYGWDWHPRLIPMGIWEDLDLELKPVCRFEDAEIFYNLSQDFSEVKINASYKTSKNADIKFTVKDPKGEVVFVLENETEATIKNPLLWWCNGYGDPNLYSWTLECIENSNVTDVKTGKIGFRTVVLEMNEGTWNEPDGFPKGRSATPITVTLNGVSIFAKGSNWVNPEVFVGTITKEIYQDQIEKAKELNFNIFRCWGGAIVNKDSFFELCDENGIMVWQEFMLACNNYIGTDKYLKVLEEEATAVIMRLRKYTSVVLWCGGNELFNSWSGMTDQSFALRLLNKLCYDLDNQRRPFIMTSPLIGMAHGCYLFKYPDGREVFQVMPNSKHTAYTEFGVPSISSLDCCKMISDEKNLFPFVKNEITTAHHAFGAWPVTYDTWSELSTIEGYFGKQNSLEELINKSQWIQGEGYKCIFEEARRQKPYCSMAINWDFNEPWPSLAGNNLLGYGGAKKKSCDDVMDACRPILASAQIPKFSWQPGEVFEAALWMLNDSLTNVEAGEITAELHLEGKVYSLLNWKYDEILANNNQVGPVIRFVLPDVVMQEKIEEEKLLNITPQSRRKGGQAVQMKLVLKAGNKEDSQKYSSVYKLVYYK